MRRRARVLLGMWALAAGQWAQAACLTEEVRFPEARARFTVEVADSPAERARGLMGRAALGSGEGMLFVYEAPGHPFFWMKDTLIGLDMVFLSPSGEILRVKEAARPLDETPIDGGAGVQYVLEIGSGLAARLGLRPGLVMSWPGLDGAAPTACD